MSQTGRNVPRVADLGFGGSGDVSNTDYQPSPGAVDETAGGKGPLGGSGAALESSQAEAAAAAREFERENPGAQG